MKKGSFLNFLLIVCLFVVKMPWVVFAGGSQDATEKSIESPAGFKEKLDINDKKPGKYNFYLEAQDKGGNITLEGPHNIYIESNSLLFRWHDTLGYSTIGSPILYIEGRHGS